MSALTSSFTANLVSVKSAAKKSQKVVVGVQAPTNSPRRYVQKTKISLGIFALLIIAHRSATKTPTRDEENENVRVDSNKRDARSRFTVVRFEFCVAFASSRGRFHSPEICLFLFTQSERSPLPTQKLKKKITQGVSFVAASVIALNAAPALAVSPIEIQDKRTENAGGLQLIYEVRLSSFARYRTAVVYECFRFVFPSFTKARSALFFVGRRRRKGMISRIKKSFFLIRRLFASKKKKESYK